ILLANRPSVYYLMRVGLRVFLMAILDLHARRQEKEAEAAVAPLQPVRRRRRIPWVRFLLVLAAVAAAGAGGWALLKPLDVRIALVATGPAGGAVYASGVVEYVRQARVAPVVTAPIRQVLVEEGQAVAAGQALAQLDDGPQEGTTLQLEAQAALART